MYYSMRLLCISLDEKLESAKLVFVFVYFDRQQCFYFILFFFEGVGCSVANLYIVERPGAVLLRAELTSSVFTQIQIIL